MMCLLKRLIFLIGMLVYVGLCWFMLVYVGLCWFPFQSNDMSWLFFLQGIESKSLRDEFYDWAGMLSIRLLRAVKTHFQIGRHPLLLVTCLGRNVACDVASFETAPLNLTAWDKGLYSLVRIGYPPRFLVYHDFLYSNIIKLLFGMYSIQYHTTWGPQDS